MCMLLKTHTHTRKDIFTTSKKVNSGGTLKVSSPKQKIPSLSSRRVSQLTNEWKRMKTKHPLLASEHHPIAKVTN